MQTLQRKAQLSFKINCNYTIGSLIHLFIHFCYVFFYYWLLVTQFPMVQPICPLVRITELCLLFRHQFKGELQSQFFV